MTSKKLLLITALCVFAFVALTAVSVVTFSPVTPAEAAGGSFSGSGSKADPFKISGENDLKKLADDVNNGVNSYKEEYFLLKGDLDLTAFYSSWTPIGTGNRPFEGTFDGGGHSITYSINYYNDYSGLFGNSKGAITNLSVTGDLSGNNYVGGIVGLNNGTVSNIKFYGTVDANGFYVGGIVGYNTGETYNCVNNAAITGWSETGGIAGFTVNTGNCTNYGTVTANYNVGGIAGQCEGQIYNCVNEKYTTVTATGLYGDDNTNAGGIVGKVEGVIGSCTNKATVNANKNNTGGIAGYCFNTSLTNCLNEGAVTESILNIYSCYGGIVGNAGADEYQESVIEDCTNRAEVNAPAIQAVGGIAGRTERCLIRNCINTAKTVGGYDVGGIAGRICSGASVESCSNIAYIEGTIQTGGIVGLQQGSGRVYNCINLGKVLAEHLVGGITGVAIQNADQTGLSTIENCTNKGNITYEQDSVGTNIGGIVGRTSSDVSNCINNGTVNGKEAVGGIVAYRDGHAGSIISCVNTAPVTGTKYVGGVAGELQTGNIEKCLNSGNVEAQTYVAGIAGIVRMKSAGTIIKVCLNTGNVTSKLDTTDNVYVGGFVGSGDTCQLYECGNTGKITAKGSEVGGLFGYAESCTCVNSYNRGIVFGYTKVGGLAGYIRYKFTATKCYSFVAEDNGSYYGIDCELPGSALEYQKTGSIVGYRFNTKVELNLSDNYWWRGSARRALGWTYISGDYSGEGYTGVYWKNDMKNKDTYANFDFSKVWVIKDDAPVLRNTLKLSAAGGLGGSGGSGGTGGTGDPVLNKIYIGSLEAFKQLRDNVNNGNSYSGMEIYLACDLDLSGENWTPIGIDKDHIFSGSFYGGGHVIKGLYIDSNSLDYAGLFGASGGVISDICVFGSVTSTGTFVGGITGYSHGFILSSLFVGDVNCTSGSGYAGGIAGVFGASGHYNDMSNCGHIGNVTCAGVAAGGVIGSKSFQFKVERVFHAGGENSVSVTNGWGNVGALIGETSQPQMVLYSIATENSAPQLFGKITGYNSPVVCNFLSPENMGNPDVVGGNGFDIGYDAGHTWGAGWDYPVLQQFGKYITVVPQNNKDDARNIWLLKDQMVMPAATYTRTAYTFNSWNTKPEGDGKKVVAGDAVAQGDVFYAQWDTIDYEIEYILNGASGSASQTYNIESTDTLQILSKPHYSFDGWKVIACSTGNWPKGEILAGGELLTGKYGGVALQAKWTELPKYTVSWYMDDGTLLGTTKVEKGSMPAYADPVKTGDAEFSYTFAGWDKPLTPVQIDTDYTATFTPVKNSYTITWKNDDGSVIDTTVVEYGKTPAHSNPTKTNSAEYTYSFKGWSPSVVSVTGDATYTATFNAAKNSYTITWKNDDGSVIDTTVVEYGKTPAHANATKQNTAEYTYTFTGWTPAVTEVIGDTEYSATFSQSKNSYTITWKNEDGSVIDTAEVEYGKMPVHDDATKANTAEKTYVFSGWSPNITTVTGDAEYTAVFSSLENSYTITWKNYDGTVIGTTLVEYGKVPTHADPERENTAEFTYTFTGWSPSVAAVTGDAEYTAEFSSAKNSYTITWRNENGSVIDTTVVEYGKMPVHKDAEKAATAEETYTFKGWTPNLVAVTGDAEYTAVFTTVKNTVTITWKNDDGTVIDTTVVEYGKLPEHLTPVKENTDEFTYTFAGWSPEITEAVGDAEYIAVFSAERNTYKVIFADEDGTELLTVEVPYGDTPAYTGETPAKAPTAQFTYTFKGWTPEITAVTGDITYTAVYEAEGISYAADKDKITWQLGSGEEVTITVKQLGDEDNSFENFKNVCIDSALLEAGKDYTATKGSTIIKLSPETLEKLTVGEHTVKIEFTYGDATVKLVIIEAEKTDKPAKANNVWIPITVTVAVVAIGAAAAVIIIKKKH